MQSTCVLILAQLERRDRAVDAISMSTVSDYGRLDLGPKVPQHPGHGSRMVLGQIIITELGICDGFISSTKEIIGPDQPAGTCGWKMQGPPG